MRCAAMLFAIVVFTSQGCRNPEDGQQGEPGQDGRNGSNCFDGITDINKDGALDSKDCFQALQLATYNDPFTGKEWYYTGTYSTWAVAATRCEVGYRLPTVSELQTALGHGLAVSIPEWLANDYGVAWADAVNDQEANHVSIQQPEYTSVAPIGGPIGHIFCIKT